MECLSRPRTTYKGMVVIGCDAGKVQKDAVRKGLFNCAQRRSHRLAHVSPLLVPYPCPVPPDALIGRFRLCVGHAHRRIRGVPPNGSSRGSGASGALGWGGIGRADGHGKGSTTTSIQERDGNSTTKV